MACGIPARGWKLCLGGVHLRTLSSGNVCASDYVIASFLATFREFVFDGRDEEDPCVGWRDGTFQEKRREAQAKADLEARQKHQMEQVYVRYYSHVLRHEGNVLGTLCWYCTPNDPQEPLEQHSPVHLVDHKNRNCIASVAAASLVLQHCTKLPPFTVPRRWILST